MDRPKWTTLSLKKKSRLGLQFKVLNTLQGVPSSLGSGARPDSPKQRASKRLSERPKVHHHLRRSLTKSLKCCPLYRDTSNYQQTHPPRTLPWAHAWGPRGLLGVWAFSYERGTPVRCCIPYCIIQLRVLPNHPFMSVTWASRGTSFMMNCTPPRTLRCTVALCLGPHGGPRGLAFPYERRTPVL